MCTKLCNEQLLISLTLFFCSNLELDRVLAQCLVPSNDNSLRSKCRNEASGLMTPKKDESPDELIGAALWQALCEALLK